MSPFIFGFRALSLLPILTLAAPTPRAEELTNLLRDAGTLQAFAKTVTSDPNNTISTWTGSDVCSYAGITCDTTPENVTAVAAIDLNGANLSGPSLSLDILLPNLLDIAVFHANSNNFTGTIPQGLGQIKYLYEIDLSNNALSGSFPTHVLDAPLTFLDLRFNSFSGPLPAALFQPIQGNLSMDVIFLNDNQFSGQIPEVGNIETVYITLANNNLEGPIPVSLGNISTLKEILLLGNKLTGNVPEELCALDLDILDVSDNAGLTGTLGAECRKLYNAGVLVIDGTGLKV